MVEALFERFIFDLPQECVNDCSRSGDMTESVLYWYKRLNLEIPEDKLRAELKEYGAWDVKELENHEDNLQRIIWIAACNIKEEQYQNSKK